MERIDDIGDQISVLEDVVEDLKGVEFKGEIQVVRNIQLLAQYIRLEDGILEELLSLSSEATDEVSEEAILELTKQFNALGSEFQNTWSDLFWEIYDSIREGFSITTSRKGTVTSRIDSLIDIAITLNKKGLTRKISEDTTNALAVLDKLSAEQKSIFKSKETCHKTNHLAVQNCTCLLF